jgi:hypothetical protein
LFTLNLHLLSCADASFCPSYSGSVAAEHELEQFEFEVVVVLFPEECMRINVKKGFPAPNLLLLTVHCKQVSG